MESKKNKSIKLLFLLLFISFSFFTFQTQVNAVVNESSSTTSSTNSITKSGDGLIRPANISESSISIISDPQLNISSSSSANPYIADKYITLKLEKLIQNIFDKSEPVRLTIDSSITTDRLEINWTYDQDYLDLSQKDTEFKTITKGEPLVLTYDFLPLKEGVNKVFVRVQAWQNEANYPEVSSIELTFNSDLEIVPQTEEYQSNLTVFNTIKIVVIVAIFIGILAVAFLLLTRFFKWFEKD